MTVITPTIAFARSYSTPEALYSRLKESFTGLRKQVVRPAAGFIKYPYLVPPDSIPNYGTGMLSSWPTTSYRKVSRNICGIGSQHSPAELTMTDMWQDA